MKQQKNPKPDNDKWYHCVTSCEITQECGEDVAKWMGNLKELKSKDEADSAADQQANAVGRQLGKACQRRTARRHAQRLATHIRHKL